MPRTFVALVHVGQRRGLLRMDIERKTISVSQRVSASIDEGSPAGIEWLRSCDEQGFLQGSEIITNMPSAKCVTKVLEFPFRERRKIVAAVPFAMEEHLAYPVDDAHFIVSPIRHTEKGTNVLCWAFRRDSLAGELEEMEAAAIDPRSMYPDSVAFAALSRDWNEDAATVNVNVVALAEGTTLIVHRGNTVLLQRRCGLGFAAFIGSEGAASGTRDRGPGDRIADRTPEQSGDDVNQLSFAWPEFGAALAREILMTVRHRDLMQFASSIDSIRLAGPLAFHNELRTHIETAVGIPTGMIELSADARRLLGDEEVMMRDDHGVHMLAAGLGVLALQRHQSPQFNVRSGSFIYRKDLSLMRGRMIVSGILVFLLIVLGWTNLYSRVNARENIYQQKRDEVQAIFLKAFPAIRVPGSEVQIARQKLQEIQSELKNFGGAGNERITPLRVLLDLSQRIPAEVGIDVQEFSMTQDKIELRGLIDTYQSVDSLQSLLEKLPYIRDVRPGKTTKDMQSESLIFQMTAFFKGSEVVP